MQKVSNDELPKRCRYYSSMIDASTLLTGVDYTNLSETFIIFLCKEDPFEKGLPVYTFKTTCQEDKHFILNDETYKFFFNAAAAEYEKDLEIQSFLNYIKCKEPTDELTDKIAKLIENIKKREQNKEAYMIEHLKVRDNIMEGLREGVQQKAIEDAINFLKEGDSPEKISRCIGLPLEKVLELQEQIKQKA